ncbi:MAG: hypothetical protein SF182_17270 [Deltaproteobacteria bacterium]|nr:hypothetical protein [Deltaproteobacteria bacterium]
MQVGVSKQSLGYLMLLCHASNILDFAVEHCTVPALKPVADELVDTRVNGKIRNLGSTAREPECRRRSGAAVFGMRGRETM